MILKNRQDQRLSTTPASLLVLVVLLALSACGGPPSAPEEEIREWVRSGVAAAEAKERRRLVGMISPAYADARGNQRDGIENILRWYFLRMNAVQLVTSIEDITVIGDTAAEVVLKVAMAGTHDGALGFSADAYRFALELERGGDDWQLISARWGELGKEMK
jgi:hypothetical protein